MKITLIEVLVVAAILFICALLIDIFFGETENISGEITNKRYSEPYTSYNSNYDSNGNLTSQTPVFHPEEFHVIVAVKDSKTSCSTYESEYHQLKIGQDVDITVTSGFFTGKYYCNPIN